MANLNINDDPILQTVEAVWDCLENDGDFDAAVPAFCRIKYTTDDRNPDKPGLLTADAPQVRVLLTGLEFAVQSSSSSSTIKVSFAIEVKPGDRRLNQVTPIAWAIYRAMTRWETYLKQVTWRGQAILKRFNSAQADVHYRPGAIPARQAQGVKSEVEPAGWQAVFQGMAELWIRRSDLQSDQT